ncbi:FAD binding domain-containing protein [Aspergillus pseudonomiae]|uniref:FAD binding domain-containing protein n=1 Tax=Aspergillus pseudonomiae TaxID=1506151 RepID=A0A5N7DRQ8_9EURO|nr:FAD binding domain-containing protein [Aspergillus pseudonomiae]KAB8264294.1 FAD binding domain-containing protein [Aspergillus pseudonomiae]KAE8409141.1 FAD binding domain-containing protein [Aspergillus pseudonomiae]
MDKTWDVVIAGAGPVGLFLACELATAGVSVLVLERETQPGSPWKEGLFGRRGLYIPSVEAFYRRGMLQEIMGDEKRPMHFEKTQGFQFGGHFAGLVVNANNIDFSRWPYHLPGPSFLPGPTSLGRLETVLTKRTETLGVQILRGREVSQLTDEGDSVQIWAGDECFTAQWLVGCDGGRSTVRKAAGFEFVGTEAQFTGYIAMCDLDQPELLQPGFTHTDSGMYIFSGPGHLHVIDFNRGFDRSQPITREHFQEVLRQVSDTNIVVKALRQASSFTDRAKQATEYRKGRILLAGDSAHIHSPLGAQGLSTGISDAMNLGWKLAATVKGVGSPGLLDTYYQERHPEAARVLEWTRAQVAILRPDPYGQAIADVMRDMIKTQEGATYLADRIWGLSLRYELGGAHPLVGCSAPDFEFDDGLRLGAKLEKASFLVIDFGGNSRVAEFVEPLQSQQFMIQYCGQSAKETFGLKGLLLRPDGIVAWVSTDEIEIQRLKDALSRWVSVAAMEA